MKVLSRLTISLILLASGACKERSPGHTVDLDEALQRHEQKLAGNQAEVASAQAEAAGSQAEAAAGLPDPAEPNISPLARLSRQIFAAMTANQSSCPTRGAKQGAMRYELDVTIAGGKIQSLELVDVGPQAGGSLAKSAWPEEVRTYVSCLAPILKRLDPTQVPDGKYPTVFALMASAE